MALKDLSPTAQGYLFTLITMFIWGSFSLLARLNAYWHIQIWDILALRFALASAVLIPILIYTKKYKFLWDYRAIILAVVGGVGYCMFVYSGFFYAPVVHGVVFLNGTFPVFASFIAFLFLNQPIDKHTKISIGIILLTVTLMSVMMTQQQHHLGWGDLFFIASAICWAGFSVLLRQWTFSAWQTMVSVAIWSTIIYLPCYFLFATPQFEQAQFHHLAIQGIFHGIFVVVIATLTYAKAVEKIGMFKAGSIATLAPFISALLAVPLLNEPLNMVMICGLIGMGIGALQPWRWLPASRA